MATKLEDNPEARRPMQDCAIVAIALAMDRSYHDVRRELAFDETPGGTPIGAFWEYVQSRGWQWHRSHRVPATGRAIVLLGPASRLYGHAAALVNGTFVDACGPSRESQIQGFFTKKE